MNAMHDRDCDHLHAYHDGELDAVASAEFERHLAACPSCLAELAGLRRLRRSIADAPMTPPPMHAAARWRLSWQRIEERRVLRLAGWMTAAAAAVLVTASLSLFMGQVQASAPLSEWEAAVLSPGVEPTEPVEPTVVMARWIAADLAAGTNGVTLR